MNDERVNQTGSTGETQVVVFALGDELYGLDIARVYEIIRHQAITAVPRSPKFVEGVINLRGRIIPVVDLRTRFGMARQSATRSTRIVVTETAGLRVGLVVDAVSEVLRVHSDIIEAAPEVVTGVDAAYLRGIAKADQRLIILLDLDGMFQADEQTALGTAA